MGEVKFESSVRRKEATMRLEAFVQAAIRAMKVLYVNLACV